MVRKVVSSIPSGATFFAHVKKMSKFDILFGKELTAKLSRDTRTKLGGLILVTM